MYVHNTLVPYLRAADEIKTKPTQHSVKELKSIGIQPDIIILRSEVDISDSQKDKIALFCDVRKEAVIVAKDEKILFNIVTSLHNQHIDDIIVNHFHIDCKEADMTTWNEMIKKIKESKEEINIGLVGKYVQLHDAYLSVSEALKSAGYHYLKKVNINYIDANIVNDENVESLLKNMDGILIPGGFGKRGSEGKISAIKYARINKVPMLGLCYGMQLACIEYARNVFGYKDANSTEIDQTTKHPIIYFLPDQYDGINMGGTLRLGLYDCHLEPDSQVYQAYGVQDIKERHRHRYEFNNAYLNILTKDLRAVGINTKQNLVEIVEMKNHPFFVGCQFHPEFLSRPDRPHPLFREFINSCIKNKMLS